VAADQTAISRQRWAFPTLDGLGCPGSGAHARHEHILWSIWRSGRALMAGLGWRLGVKSFRHDDCDQCSRRRRLALLVDAAR